MMAASQRNTWWWPAGLVATALVCTFGAASAASLGGVTAPGLAAFVFAATSGASSVLAHENFTGTGGSNLNSTSTDSGGFTWAATSGTWTVQANQARSTSADTSILFNSGVSNSSAEATISRNGNNSWDTNVAVNANASGSDALIANWWSGTNGNLDLYKRVSGSYTQLVTVSGLYPGTIPASATIRIESPSTSVIKVYLDGVLKITYTLTSGEVTTFKNNTHRHAGIGAYFDSSSTFDNFHLDT